VGEATPADDPLALVMPPAHLESQVRLLQRAGYEFRCAGEIAATGLPAPRGTAVLTFDDGWRDSIGVVAPLLTRLGVPATFYVNPGLWGAQHADVSGPAGRLLDEAGARELAAKGFELGSHTMTHHDLRIFDDRALAAELVDSKSAVEAVTGQPCTTLAYPFGAFDERVERAAQAAGYGLAYAWLPGPWRPFAAPRLPAPTRRGGGHLALKLAGVRKRRRIGPPPSAARLAIA
jgi:peptidoglycan/xylan/chitin deacetylase (PgdA/CDA1 family)